MDNLNLGKGCFENEKKFYEILNDKIKGLPVPCKVTFQYGHSVDQFPSLSELNAGLVEPGNLFQS